MRKIIVNSMVFAAVVLLFSGPSWADVLCQKKNGILTARSTCKKKESQVDPATLGLVGPPGAKGDKGDKGDTGSAGPGAQWVFANKDGTILAQSGGIAVTRLGLGNYVVDFGSSVANKVLSLTQVCIDSSCPDVGGTQAGVCGGGAAGVTCGAPHNNANSVLVYMENTSNATGVVDLPFYLAAF